MKTFTVAAAIAALATVGSAQLDKIPECALSCFLGPLGSDGCSELTDFKCHCEKAESLFAAVIPCVQKACEEADQQAAIDATKQTCSDAGVEVDVPVEVGQSSAAPSATPSATPSASASESEVETSTAVETSTVVETSTSVSAYPTPSGNGTNTEPSATPTPSEFPGSAGQAGIAVGALAAALAAFL